MLLNESSKDDLCEWRKSLKNQTCDVIKMRETRGEVGNKTPYKEMDNH